MSSFVKNVYPERLHKMSVIIGNGYCFRLMTLFNWRKPLIQRSLSSFLGIIYEGDAHSLSCCAARTPILSQVALRDKSSRGLGTCILLVVC
jgi:hypothetical protein